MTWLPADSAPLYERVLVRYECERLPAGVTVATQHPDEWSLDSATRFPSGYWTITHWQPLPSTEIDR